VKDVSAVALFEVNSASMNDQQKETLPDQLNIAAWTTTPWTLPSNTALAVGEKVKYAWVQCKNPYTQEIQNIIIAERPDSFLV
jgi:isoleucyl-tRNA synthetase